MTNNPYCQLCWLYKSANIICMPCRPNIKAPLQIFVDSPTAQDEKFGGYGSSMVSRLLFWMLEKWSLTPEEVGINFALRCCASSLKKKVDKLDALAACNVYSNKYVNSAKALLGMGEVSSMRLLGDRPLKNTVYQQHDNIFISYSPGFFLQKPAETIDGLRMLYKAAEAASLTPLLNKDLELFDFGVI